MPNVSRQQRIVVGTPAEITVIVSDSFFFHATAAADTVFVN